MRVYCTAENQEERLFSTRQHSYFGVMQCENLEVSIFSKWNMLREWKRVPRVIFCLSSTYCKTSLCWLYNLMTSLWKPSIDTCIGESGSRIGYHFRPCFYWGKLSQVEGSPSQQGFWYLVRSWSHEIQVNPQNTAKFSRNLIKYMSVRHLGYWGCLLAVNVQIYLET